MRLIALCALLCFALIGRADDYRRDPRLVKPISIRVKLVPLSTCVKAFSDATGVGIYVAPSIAERKVTVIFKDRPASDAMTMLAQTLFFDWTTEVGGYRLESPHEAVNEELGMLSAEDAVLKERLAATVKELADTAARPKEELIEQRDKMQAELDRLRPSRDPDAKKKYEELRKQYRKFNWLSWYDIGYALRNGPAAIDALTAGETVFASTKRGEALPLPITAIPQGTVMVLVPGPDGKPMPERRTATGAVAAIRCNPVTGRLQYKTLGTGLGDQGGIQTGQEAWLLESGEAENKLWRLPLRKHLRDWGRTLDAGLLARKMPKEAAAPVSPGYAAQAFTIADHLEHLADAAGVCIVADAYRLPVSGEGWMGGATVGDYVRELRDKAVYETRGATFRTENGWLLCRHAHYWRFLNSEIPEVAYAAMEAKVKAGEALTLDDYATFAGRLTPWQAMVFSYRPSLTRFPRVPLIEAMPALRLWASLGADQRQQAYVGGLPATEMSPDELRLYRVAVNELLWVGHLNETFLPILMNGSAANSGVGLFLLDANNGINTNVPNRGETLDPPQRQLYTSADLAVIRAHSYEFAFGSTPHSNSSYSFEIVPVTK